MRILYGITKSNFGGAQRYVFDLASEAKKQGHEVALLCGGDGILTEKFIEVGIEVISVPALNRDVSLVGDLKSFFAIHDALKKWRPDVFHINSSKMGGMGAVAARLLNVRKIVFTSHGWAFNESWRPKWQKKLIKFLHWVTLISSHQTICVSIKTARDVSHLPFVREKLKIIWNGIAPFALKLRDEARLLLYPAGTVDTLLVGSLGELHRVKGIDVLLDSWQKFVVGRDAKLIIMGDGEERENLQNYR
jgi:glycosyltransferase involved in cell wall biosynthesis